MADVYGSSGIEAAKIVGDGVALDEVAAKLEALARAEAAGHGDLASHVHRERVRGKKGVTDRLVYIEHEAAAAIEFGHAHPRRPDLWVKGLHTLRNARSKLEGGG